ncbi:hypothetical protein WN944_017312 [Citrus x changshan-huyou]|uniref:NAC domain-containing protein n=1 Tax=Citrus x changshan-huyou TaxID=2935761 RepID=A0AAP0QSV8_9ROSI
MDYNCLGYRFRPTEDEIITYFLQNKIHGHASRVRAINTINICAFEPWELPEQAATPDDEEWYFFSELQKKYANSDRVDRTTKLGSWKVTGGDRQIWDNCGKEVIGVKKNLVFHKGHGSKAKKTSWVIHEYHSSKASVHQAISSVLYN